MKQLAVLCLLIATFCAQAEMSSNAERLRIGNARSALEAGFLRDEKDCYQKFLVNSCLEKIKSRRRDAMDDLRRQEILLNEQERKFKAAEQVKKTEEKQTLEEQQQAADLRSRALKDFDVRLARDEQKTTTRTMALAGAKSSEAAAKNRAKNAQDKQAARLDRQAGAAEELTKYNQRVAKALERQARFANEKANQSKPSAQPLPVPD